MEITPKRTYKVENPEKIRELAKDVVRMANAEHPMLDATYERLVDIGVKYPYFTQMALKNAEYDLYIKAADEYVNADLTKEEYLNKFKTTRENLSKLDKSATGMRLYDSMKAIGIKNVEKTVSRNDKKAFKKAMDRAKKYMQMRIAVLSGLAEGSHKLVPCSANKAIKKFTYRFLRLLNR